MLKFFSSLIWLLFCGIWLSLIWMIIGCFLCITIIGIPFGLQCFKLANLCLFPQDAKIDLHFKKHPIANIIWAVLGGWEMAILHFVFGLVSCLTIIGIPRGLKCFKIMKLAIFPFGAKIH